MHITNRSWLRYGREDDYIEITTLEHETFEKALKYAQRYARGIKFVNCTIEDEKGNILYEISDYGAKEEDFRDEVKKNETTEKVVAKEETKEVHIYKVKDIFEKLEKINGEYAFFEVEEENGETPNIKYSLSELDKQVKEYKENGYKVKIYNC